MTALKQYQRLESTGLWRASPDAQRIEVIVALGDATLTLSDTRGSALAHWSLPAVERVNPGETPAIFRPGPDAAETLELNDDTMIGAIARVQAAIERRRPHPGRLRFYLSAGVVAAVAAVAVFWLPGAMVDYTASVVPASQRAMIGEDLLTNIRRVAGSPCDTPRGTAALEKMHRRLFGDSPGRIVVLASGVRQSEHLPGHIILLNRALVEDYEDPDVPAGFALAEDLRARQTDPLVRLLRASGIGTAFQLLTTGTISQDRLAQYAEDLLLPPPSRPSDASLAEQFRRAGVRASPYAYALDISGETTLGLIEADAVPEKTAVPVLSDGDWISLQAICGE